MSRILKALTRETAPQLLQLLHNRWDTALDLLPLQLTHRLQHIICYGARLPALGPPNADADPREVKVLPFQRAMDTLHAIVALRTRPPIPHPHVSQRELQLVMHDDQARHLAIRRRGIRALQEIPPDARDGGTRVVHEAARLVEFHPGPGIREVDRLAAVYAVLEEGTESEWHGQALEDGVAGRVQRVQMRCWVAD